MPWRTEGSDMDLKKLLVTSDVSIEPEWRYEWDEQLA